MTGYEKNDLGMRISNAMSTGQYGRGPSIDELIRQQRNSDRKHAVVKFLLLVLAAAAFAAFGIWAWDREGRLAEEGASVKESRTALIETMAKDRK